MKQPESNNSKKPLVVLLAFLYTGIAIYFGYIALGFWPAFIFTFGFLGGFVLWLIVQAKPSFKYIRFAYFGTLVFFIFHKIEERKMDFFPTLSEITGVPVPDAGSLPAIFLYIMACAWLLIPVFVCKKYAFGYYLAWTFFCFYGNNRVGTFCISFI